MQSWWTRWFGDRGERAAVRFLRRKGWRIIARQYRTSHGEIDLIAQDGAWIVFVEVKTRQSHAKGHPTEAVTSAKQVQLTKLALTFLKKYRRLNQSARFDVIAITWPETARQPIIEHYINAFPPTGVNSMFS